MNNQQLTAPGQSSKIFFLIKKFLEIDYPRSRATEYYANFLALRATWISKNKRQNGNPGPKSGEFFLLNLKAQKEV